MPFSHEMYERVKSMKLTEECRRNRGEEIYEMIKDMDVEIIQPRKPVSGGALNSEHEFETAAKNLVWIIEGSKLTLCYRDAAGNVVSFKIQTPPSRVMYGNLEGLGGRAKLKTGKLADKRKLSVTLAMGDLKTSKLDLDPKNAAKRRRPTQQAMVTLLRAILLQYCLLKTRNPSFQHEDYNALEGEAANKDWYKNLLKEAPGEKELDPAEKKAAKAKRMAELDKAREVYIFSEFFKKVNCPFTDADPKPDGYFGAQYKIKYTEQGLPAVNEHGEPVLETDSAGHPVVVPCTTIKMSRADFYETKATDSVPPVDPRIMDMLANPKSYTDQEVKWAQEVMAVQGPQSTARKHFDPVKVTRVGSKEPFPVFGPFFGRGSTACVRCNIGFFNESTSFGMNLYFESAAVFDIHNDGADSEMDTGYNYDEDKPEQPVAAAESKKRPAGGDSGEDEDDHGYNVEPEPASSAKKKSKPAEEQ